MVIQTAEFHAFLPGIHYFYFLNGIRVFSSQVQTVLAVTDLDIIMNIMLLFFMLAFEK